MLVLIRCTTDRVGCDTENVYEFDDDSTEEYLQEYANDCARDNAELYDIINQAREEAENCNIEFDECDCYCGKYEILDMTKEEVIDIYGEILEP